MRARYALRKHLWSLQRSHKEPAEACPRNRRAKEVCCEVLLEGNRGDRRAGGGDCRVGGGRGDTEERQWEERDRPPAGGAGRSPAAPVGAGDGAGGDGRPAAERAG